MMVGRVVVGYARERMLRVPVFAAVLVVTAGAQIGRGMSSAAAIAIDLAISLCLVISFRIWDDVMDRERDRIVHPERVLVRARSIAPLSIAASCLALAGAFALLRVDGAGSLSLLIAFTGVLATWYARRGPRSAGGDRLLLFKYPIFTLALIGTGSFTPRAAASALAVYLAACVYEWRHDRESPLFHPVMRLLEVSEPHDGQGAHDAPARSGAGSGAPRATSRGVGQSPT